MPSVDLTADYKKVQDKITANKTYVNLKSDYNRLQKKAGDSFEDLKSDVTSSIENVKKDVDRYQKQVKDQISQLLDINNLSSPNGSNTIRYLKKTLLVAIKNIEPKISEILLEEVVNILGCDQQQTFNPGPIYIRVSAVDFAGLLKNDPNEKPGLLLYEKLPSNQPQVYPFSMNRELWNRIQSSSSYFTDYGTYYKGQSGQDLFDIQFVDTNAIGVTGPWFKIDLQNRTGGINKVGEFLADYYKTIRIVDFKVIITSIMEALTGAISIKANIGLVEVEDQKKFEAIVQRILGLCFDNRRQIDVSGIAKLGELDNVDESFFEFTDVQLRQIEQEVSNIKNGVVEFLDCTDVKLPVNTNDIIDGLGQMNFIPDDDEITVANNITDALINNPEWVKLGIRGNIEASVNFRFVKLMVQGLISGLLLPKVLLPVFIMLKALGQYIDEQIQSFMDFLRLLKSKIINLISRIGGLLVQEIFNIIKKDIKNLIQQIILDVVREKADKRIIMILKLIQLLITIAQFIRDWRECKSVVDELLWLLRIATSGWGGEIPLPLLFASRLLDGFSSTRAFIGTIEELQKIGIPTGPMPDGSPNLTVLSIFSQLKASAAEEAENGKVQLAVPPLAMTPAGLTVPQSAFGKKF
jgi:hypothetical protein